MKPEDVVAEVFGLHAATVNDATSNENVAAWDSMGHINLLVELESRYSVSFSAADALRLTSVAAIKTALSDRGIRW